MPPTLWQGIGHLYGIPYYAAGIHYMSFGGGADTNTGINAGSSYLDRRPKEGKYLLPGSPNSDHHNCPTNQSSSGHSRCDTVPPCEIRGSGSLGSPSGPNLGAREYVPHGHGKSPNAPGPGLVSIKESPRRPLCLIHPCKTVHIVCRSPGGQVNRYLAKVLGVRPVSNPRT